VIWPASRKLPPLPTVRDHVVFFLIVVRCDYVLEHTIVEEDD